MHLRIAHVTATFPPYRGGTGNVCFHNARELARRAHDVHVFTAAVPGALPNERCEGVVVHRLRPLVRVGNAPVLPALMRALQGFNIIHLHYPFILGAEVVRLAAKRYHTPLVLSFHNDLIGNGARARLFKRYQQCSALITVRGAARVCAVSLDHYRSSELARSLAGDEQRLVELPNGVAPEQFHPAGPTDIRMRYGIPDDAAVVLFVAALDRAHHFKNLGVLLRAVQQLPHHVWLMVVGDGDCRPMYEQLTRHLSIADRTIFVGAVDHEHTPPFFRGADVTVLPSSPPESFGLVLIESMASGTPVIASDIPGVRSVVEHGGDGLLVAPNNPRALAEAIRTMLADEAMRQAMSRQGRTKVEAQYAWSSIGQRLEAVYYDVLSTPQAVAQTYAKERS